jgi:hypothetical protein
VEPSNDLTIIYFLIFVGVTLYIAYELKKRRSKKLELEADSLGLSFDKKGRDDSIEKHAGFNLFSQGIGKEIMNEMWGDYNDIKASAFGYQFILNSQTESDSITYKQTVLSIDVEQKNVPDFELVPVHFMHKIGRKLGFKDVKLPSHSEFSDQFLLTGDNEESVQQFFSSDIVEMLKNKQDISMEFKSNRLLIYRSSVLCKPGMVSQFLEEGRAIYHTLIKEG